MIGWLALPIPYDSFANIYKEKMVISHSHKVMVTIQDHIFSKNLSLSLYLHALLTFKPYQNYTFEKGGEKNN